MRRFVSTAILLAVGCCLPGCERDESEKKSPKQIMVLDKQSRPGRVFMYIDDQGNAIKTRHYKKIPLDKRKAVMVLQEPRKEEEKNP